MNDFDELKMELVRSDATIKNGHYVTVTPILQFHLKKMYVSGNISDAKEGHRECLRVNPSVKFEDVDNFLKDNLNSLAWIQSREDFLQRQYETGLADAAKLTSLIDQKYDLHFDMLRDVCAKKIDYLKELDPEFVKPMHLKILSETLKMGYEMQRLGRGMVQGVRADIRIEESEKLMSRIQDLEEALNAKTVDVKILNPI